MPSPTIFLRRRIRSIAFRKSPSIKAEADNFDLAIVPCANATTYIIGDIGARFREDELWRDSQPVEPRVGALKQHGAIAAIERCNRTLKDEFIRIV